MPRSARPPAASANTFSLSVEVNQRDINRITKRLDKWQGAELHKRVDKAMQGGLGLYVRPIRDGARSHHVTGDTERSVKVKKLRKKIGEVVAYKVGPTTWYGHFPIAGPYSAPGDPSVERAERAYSGAVLDFVEEQVRRLG